MIKLRKDYSTEEKILMALLGISSALYEACRDHDNYQEYKKGKITNFSKETIQSMNLLDILQKLGYPMDELGTYLYKDLILEVYKRLDKKDNYKELLDELNNPFSSLYHYVAREEKELGIKPFHQCIEQAIEERKINNKQIDYKTEALQIALYTKRHYSQKSKKRKKIINK